MDNDMFYLTCILTSTIGPRKEVLRILGDKIHVVDPSPALKLSNQMIFRANLTFPLPKSPARNY
jgi:hypothetical protein